MTKTILRITFITLLLQPNIQVARAATSYVIDSFEITLRTGPSNTHKIIRMLPTDEPLEVLQEQGNWLSVRTRQGDEGWVLKRYVSQELPKSSQIQQLTKRNEQLAALSGGAADQIEALEKENSSLQEALTSTQKEHQQLQEKHATLESDAANVLALKQKYTETEEKLAKTAADLDRFSTENQKLRTSSKLQWFLSGAGVALAGWLIGFLMGFGKRRQQFSRRF